MNVIEHYDKLIEEHNDPVYDPAPLKTYMERWDGQPFVDAMKLNKTKTVLEIGVGTGRLALKTLPFCGKFVGIDLSPKTVESAVRNLSGFPNAELVCGDFMTWNFGMNFDVIYSSLTFMHIREKQKCIQKVAALLKAKGRFVLSVDKNREKWLDYGSRRIEIYPDNPEDITAYLKSAGLIPEDRMETEFAWIFVSVKA